MCCGYQSWHELLKHNISDDHPIGPLNSLYYDGTISAFPLVPSGYHVGGSLLLTTSHHYKSYYVYTTH
ncbi:hypothetical protein HAX54_023581, partial [Datura stramonium]|nr:hypothetical protein [Datura stramonium]